MQAYKSAADDMRAAMKRIVELKIKPYFVARDGYKSDSIDEDIDSAMDAYTAETDAIVSASEVAARRLAERISSANAREFSRIMQQYGISAIDSSRSTEEIVRAFVRNNVRFVRSVRGQLRDQVADVLNRGLQSGTRWEAIADQIAERGLVSQSRAELIARDQTGKLFGALTRARSEAAGFDRYEWSTAGDEKVRDEHIALNEKVFFWSDPPSEGHPGEPVNCRCVALPVFAED